MWREFQNALLSLKKKTKIRKQYLLWSYFLCKKEKEKKYMYTHICSFLQTETLEDILKINEIGYRRGGCRSGTSLTETFK